MEVTLRATDWKLPDDFVPRRPAAYHRGVTAETVSQLCHEGRCAEAVEALGVLVQTDGSITKSLVYAVLKMARKDCVVGRRVHALAVKSGYQFDTFVGNQFLRMYASHGRLQDAMDVFAEVAKPDAFTWSAIISAHADHAQEHQAIELYNRMCRSAVQQDSHVFVAVLKACSKVSDLRMGQQVHADVLATGVEPDLFVCTGLMNMYAKCGSLEDAQKLFDGLRRKDVVAWNTMIAGYSQQGMGQEALLLYSAMQEEGISVPNSMTFVSLLQACASVGNPGLEMGKLLHAQARQQGHEANVFVASSLVSMYARCGSLEDAQTLFNGLGEKDDVTWTALIAGYSQQGLGQEALRLYSAMQEEGTAVPSSKTFVCLLQACASVGASGLEKGKQLHAEIRERGHQADVFVASSLVNMYAKCGSLEDAQSVFDGLVEKDDVTWTALIAGYAQQGQGHVALCLYNFMEEEGIAVPNSVTFACLLQACAIVGISALEKGRQLHSQVREKGYQTDVFVASSLVSMYAKCGSLEDAQRVFDGLVQKDVVTWTAMIAGYSQQGMGEEALRLYNTMQQDSIAVPNSVTYMCLLQACANLAALQLGRQLHAQIDEHGLQADSGVAGSVINMYGKCGSMVDAKQVFDGLQERDVIAWNALIAGYACQGDSEVVFDLVQRMKESGIQPVSVTFLSILSVCSQAGLVNKGQEYFEAMSKQHGINPTSHHLTCLVDLLGRAGQLDEAVALVRTMPALPDAVVWHTLLGACQKWSNVEVGHLAFQEALKLDARDAEAYVLMSNIYTGAQMWEEAQRVQATRLQVRAWKQPGQSWWTDMDGQVHSFFVGDDKHDYRQARPQRVFSESMRQGCMADSASSPPNKYGRKREVEYHILPVHYVKGNSHAQRHRERPARCG